MHLLGGWLPGILLCSLVAAAAGAAGFVRTSIQQQGIGYVELAGSQATAEVVASFYAEFEADLFLASPCKPDPSCTTPTILPCCTSCPSEGRDCHCPPSGATCLDTIHNNVSGDVPLTGELRFSIGLSSSGCQDLAVGVSPNLVASRARMDGELELCTDAGPPSASSFNFLIASHGLAVVPISFTLLVLESSPASPQLLLPQGFFWHIIGSGIVDLDLVLTCPVPDSNTSVSLNISNQLTYPTSDPALAYINGIYPVLDVWRQPLPSSLLSFNIPLLLPADFFLAPLLSVDTPLTECTLRVHGFRNATGALYPPSLIHFQPQVLSCSASELSVVLTALDVFSTLLAGNATSYNFQNALVSLMSSNPWVGCSGLLSSLLDPHVSGMDANFTGCLSTLGTPAFASDPCCNSTLASAFQCCHSRQATNVTTWDVNQDAVAAHCKTPACTQGFLSSNVASQMSLTPAGCNTLQLEAVEDPRLTGSIATLCSTDQGTASQLLPVPCTSHSDCRISGICEPNPVFAATSLVASAFPLTQNVCRPASATFARGTAECIVSLASPFFRLFLIQPLSLPSNVSDADLADALVREYSRDVCLVLPTQSSSDPVNGTCQCANLGCASCNWQPSLTIPDLCSAPGWRGDSFCSFGLGCEQASQCTEVSRFHGCFYSFPGDQAQSSSLCKAAGGIPEATGSPPELNCWFAKSATPAACLLLSFCDSPRLRSVPAMRQTWCDEYCALPSLTSAVSCTCNNTAKPSLCSRYGLEWNVTLGECLLVLDANNTRPLRRASVDCSLLGGKYWHGAFWQEDLYADEASCQSHGLCTSDPGLFLDPTTGLANAYTQEGCEQLVGCDVANALPGEAGCAATGLCSSLLELGRCVSPTQTTAMGTPTCGADTFTGPLFPGTTCYDELSCFQPATVPSILPHRNRSECLADTACLLPNAFVLASKSPADCVACGGVVRPRNSWFPANWGPGVFIPFVWRARSWTYSAVPATALALPLSRADYANPGGITATLLAQTIICKQQLQWNVLPLLACDCGVDARADCYTTPQFQQAAQTVVCVGQPSSFWPVIAGASPSFGLNSTGAPVVLTPQSSPCVSAFFSVAQQELFSRPSTSPFSSLLLSTLRTDSYAILRNDRGVPFAQLRGDVVQLSLSQQNSSTLIGSSLCLCDRDADPAPASFSVPDYATFDPQTTSFAPLFLPVFRSPYECTALCINTTVPGTYAPIMRTPNPAGTGWADLLGQSEKDIFLAAIVLFSAFGALAGYRLLSLLLAHRTALKSTAIAAAQLALLLVFCLLRATLFGLLCAGRIPFEASPSLFAFVEIPTMIEFSLAVFVAYVWASSYHTSGDGTSRHPALLGCALAGNGLLLAVFLSALIALAVVGPSPVITACLAPAFPPQVALDRAYKVSVALIALCLALLLAVYGLLNFRSLRGHGVRGFQLWQFAIVAIATVAGLLGQAALVFYIAFRPGTLAVLILGATAELLRPAALLLTARLRGWRDDWCFGAGTGTRPKVAEYALMQEDEL